MADKKPTKPKTTKSTTAAARSKTSAAAQTPEAPVENTTNTTLTTTTQPEPEVKGTPNTREAKSRFSAALDEAKAGASALTQEAKDRANTYKGQAKTKSGDWSTEAKTKSRDLAVEGKAKASEALVGLSRTIDENAPKIDEKLGVKYGDYARSASQSIQGTAESLNNKSVDELTADAREFVRKSPGTAVGIAAVVGFMFARLFRR